jgi:BNR repeat-like domain
MDVGDRGLVFLGDQGRECSSACFHGVCVLPGGRWLVGFRASPKKADTFPQRVLVTWSDDEGKTWSTPVEPWAERDLDGIAGAWRAAQPTALGGERVAMALYWVDASGPERPFFNEQTEGLLDSRIFLTLSGDAGQTWSSPRLLDTSPFDMPTPITGPILILPNGEWALQFETNKSYHDPSVWHHKSVLMYSSDEGRTWPEFAEVAADPQARVFYWDQRPRVLADGSLLDVFWTFDRQRAVYLDIHARASTDNGRTWSEIWDTGVPGQPAPPVPLGDDRIVMPYVDRRGTPAIKARTSSDGGRTWPDATEVALDDRLNQAQEGGKSSMQDAWSEMTAFSVGLPTSAGLPDGDVLVVYYAGPKPDHTGIYWVRLEP